MTRIYHGSNHIIEEPKYGIGKRYNDYGQGFYCTFDENMAMEWAVSENRSGFANAYECDLDKLNILELNSDSYIMLHWLTLLLQYRTFELSSPLALEAKEYLMENFSVDIWKYDVIIGYRADDSYFSFAQDFLNGTISYRQLCNAMILGELGKQVVLISEHAFQHIHFKEAKVANKDIWHESRVLRDIKARREYLDRERYKRRKEDIYIMQIIDEGMKSDDARLQ